MPKFVAAETMAGVRIDTALTQYDAIISRSFAKYLTNNDKISVNGKPVKSSYKLKVGDVVTAILPANQIIASIDIPIIYEDKDVIVLNKPSGVLTHSKGGYNPEPTVASFIEPKLKNLTGNRAGIVHRLDRGTSGVIICAKNSNANKYLQKQFAQHKVVKTYVAIAINEFKNKEAIIDMPIERNPKLPQTFRVGEGGKHATTKYKVLKTITTGGQVFSQVLLEPKTGRTHQLRVHLEKLGHPIVGDWFYGGAPFNRLMLHAQSIDIVLPSGKQHHFSAELPDVFNNFKSLFNND